MELIKASVGGGNNHITLALLLAAAFFLLAAAHPPLSTATTNPVQEPSVLMLPTDANITALEMEELCCDDCGICTLTLPPKCTCNDVRKECPTWCKTCVELFGGGKICLDLKLNYCKRTCNKKKAVCCDDCGICTKSIPPICSCMDVLEECPYWCKNCLEVVGGKVCRDMKTNYCEKTCPIY